MSEMKDPRAEELVKQVEGIAAKIEQLISITNYSLKNVSDPLRTLAKQINTLPEEDLITAYSALMEMPLWTQIPGQLDEILEKTAAAMSGSLEVISMEAASGECSLGQCPGGPSQSYLDDLSIAIAAADVATAAAQLTADTLEALSFGVAAKIAQVVASGLDTGSKAISLTLAVKEKDAHAAAECENEAVKRLLISMCNTLTIIDTKLDRMGAKLEEMDKKLDIILELLMEVKKIVTEILLHQIEEALLECKKLVGLYLPEEYHGSINKVQAIVKELIDYSQIAGLTAGNANSYYSQGSLALLNGEYQTALDWFMLAYRQLPTPEICKLPCPEHPCDRGECCPEDSTVASS